MGSAFGWGLFAGASLIIGGALTMVIKIPSRVLGLIMAFGAGVLVSALAFELVEEALTTSGRVRDTAAGLFAGSLVYWAGDTLLDKWGAQDRKSSAGKQAGGFGLAIVLGIVLDGIPESMVIGLSLITGGAIGVTVVVAVFLSNLPEAIAATTGLRQSGWSNGRITALWLLVTLVSGLAALAGYALFQDASPGSIAFVLAFAGGAILTMLADTMMPEAFTHGGRLVGLVTTLGFASAVAVDALS